MRCKPNDPVMVIRGGPTNLGRVGTVLRWVRRGEHLFHETDSYRMFNDADGWLVEGRFVISEATLGISMEAGHGVFADERLFPLRGGQGTDEMLRIAGHPLREADLELHPKHQVEHAR